MRVLNSLITAMATAAVFAVPMEAQQHRHGDGNQQPDGPPACMAMQGMMSMAGMHGMMSMNARGGDMQPNATGMMLMMPMRFGPQHLLAQKDKLGLTSDQVERLEALSKDLRSPDAMPAMMATGKRLGQIFTGEAAADTAAARQVAEDMGAQHTRMLARHLTAAAAARNVLTSSQRATAATLPPPCPAAQMGDSTMKMMKKGQ